MLRLALCAALVNGAALLAAPPEVEERFTAALADGSRLTGKDVTPWYDTNSQPKLSGKLLFDSKNPLRWLRDNSLPAAERPESFVEFFGGDRLPCRALRHVRNGHSRYDAEPEHLVVKPLVTLDWPAEPREAVRVATAWLRRIVWKRQTGDRYEPGTVYCLDGRRLKFRSLRFAASSVSLLLDDGTASLEFSQLAELHMPRLDSWNCYFEQLAVLSPECSSRLLRLETLDGLCVTTSTERFQASHYGSHNPDRWYHMAQPAWSLDPLWIGFRTIRLWRCWEPHRPPLSGMEVSRAAAGDSGDGSLWPWRLDRNARGGPLHCADQEFGWGFGTHAPCTLAMELPACARRLHVRVGLDEVVGQGGCAAPWFS